MDFLRLLKLKAKPNGAGYEAAPGPATGLADIARRKVRMPKPRGRAAQVRGPGPLIAPEVAVHACFSCGAGNRRRERNDCPGLAFELMKRDS